MIKNNRKKAVAQAISTAVALGWAIMQVESAQAATLTVNNLNDSGVGSLRDTINIANSNDVVEFLLGSHPSTIALTSGTLAMPAAGYAYAKDLTINGPGTNLLTISSNNQFPVLDISAANVTLSGLAIAGDFNAYDSGNLTFTNSTISGDNVNIDSNLTLINSTISADNVKIDNATDNLELINSTISSNNNIEINTNDLTLTDYSHIVSSNNTEINAKRLNVQDYSNIGTSNGITNGGNLSISTNNVDLNNDGEINAGSNNLGAGGEITITTNSLFIRDGATLNVNSGSISDGLGGNISLKVVPQTSAIAAGSNNSGVAGNITINTGFLLAPPTEPSAIAGGNINSGAGGSITVTASDVVFLTRVPEPSAIAGSILAGSLAWLAKRKQAAFRKAKA
ncbi:MAG: PEP-CTERM sorting domain-containing protein [Nostoc sp. NOS(2021)]|uniref:PEP-CTERM sorting domain-containing protein n=1 Tax=Nostoc sp. NOS(2021) TaxID=2815407 RepID=UPI0025FD24DD|nr:PEP-CTERM sorting domain-containing protein [Nostoc sp. NOS(2021)]MBN3898953.1 PEP-CTERM sorting domain-containing protein [Nostoc sp. NOS(2021)]